MVLKQQNNAMSNLAPPARKQGFTVQTGGSGFGDGGLLGNNIANNDFPAKLSPFTSKKRFSGRAIPWIAWRIADIF